MVVKQAHAGGTGQLQREIRDALVEHVACHDAMIAPRVDTLVEHFVVVATGAVGLHRATLFALHHFSERLR